MHTDFTDRFDAELVENIIVGMSRGKAAGLDGLTAEHLQYCDALLPAILAKLFNIMMCNGHVPQSFGQSYTVPLHKGNTVYSKSATVDDFRGISISPVLSKIFEHCVLNRYQKYFVTSDNQFGFKKKSGCSHAIYTLRCAVNEYNNHGSTINLCALDISKAFDKMNHYGLFIKLMNRLIPINLLSVLENWFNIGLTCVKWGSVLSRFFVISCGIRQGGVLSPYLFAIFIDSVVDKINKMKSYCGHINNACCSIFLYADDIILLSPSVTALEMLLHICEQELEYLDLAINIKKSACLRIGPRPNAVCADIVTASGHIIKWVDNIRYLGIHIVNAKTFSCCFDTAKRSFYRTFNAIFGKVGRMASENVILHLVKSKCLPILLYGLDACPINKAQLNSLTFCVTGALMKIFSTRSKDLIIECMNYFNFSSVEVCLSKRKRRFLSSYLDSKNLLCNLFSVSADKERNAIC